MRSLKVRRTDVACLVVACFLTLACSKVYAGGAEGGGSGSSQNGFGSALTVIDTILEADTAMLKLARFLKDTERMFGRGAIVLALRNMGLVDGEVPDIPVLQALAAIVPYGEIIFSAPKVY